MRFISIEKVLIDNDGLWQVTDWQKKYKFEKLSKGKQTLIKDVIKLCENKLKNIAIESTLF